MAKRECKTKAIELIKIEITNIILGDKNGFL